MLTRFPCMHAWQHCFGAHCAGIGLELSSGHLVLNQPDCLSEGARGLGGPRKPWGGLPHHPSHKKDCRTFVSVCASLEALVVSCVLVLVTTVL